MLLTSHKVRKKKKHTHKTYNFLSLRTLIRRIKHILCIYTNTVSAADCWQRWRVLSTVLKLNRNSIIHLAIDCAILFSSAHTHQWIYPKFSYRHSRVVNDKSIKNKYTCSWLHTLHVRLDYFIRIPWSRARLIRFEHETIKILLLIYGNCIENTGEGKEFEIDEGTKCSSSHYIHCLHFKYELYENICVFRFIYTKNFKCVWHVFYSTSFFFVDEMNVWRINVNLLAYWKMGKPTFNVHIIVSL